MGSGAAIMQLDRTARIVDYSQARHLSLAAAHSDERRSFEDVEPADLDRQALQERRTLCLRVVSRSY